MLLRSLLTPYKYKYVVAKRQTVPSSGGRWRCRLFHLRRQEFLV
jgi:hypothetical protein